MACVEDFAVQTYQSCYQVLCENYENQTKKYIYTCPLMVYLCSSLHKWAYDTLYQPVIELG